MRTRASFGAAPATTGVAPGVPDAAPGVAVAAPGAPAAAGAVVAAAGAGVTTTVPVMPECHTQRYWNVPAWLNVCSNVPAVSAPETWRT